MRGREREKGRRGGKERKREKEKDRGGGHRLVFFAAVPYAHGRREKKGRIAARVDAVGEDERKKEKKKGKRENE